MVSLRIAAWSYVGLVALAAAIGGEVWGLRVHTLHASGRWHSAKLDLARPVDELQELPRAEPRRSP